MTDTTRDNLTDSKDLAESTPQVPAVRDFTADDLDPAYGSHGTQPNGVNYTPERRQAIFTQFLEACYDGKSVRKALRDCGVSWGTVSRWLATSDEWAAQYARAKEAGAQSWAERAVAEAWKPASSMVDVQRHRLRSEVARWRAAVQSKDWNEKAQGDVNVQVNVTTNQVMMDQLRRRNLSDG